MNFFSRFGFAAIALTFLVASAPSYAATPQDADKYIEGVADKTLSIISGKAGKEQKQAQLEKLFGDAVDFQWVGRFVMGRFWRQATDAQKARYVKDYQKFLVLHYTSRFVDYASGKFKVTGARDDGENEFTVNMEIQPGDDPHAEPVLVDYRVRAENGSFKIFDVIVEGVSMITTQRSEFASVINDHGIDYLIDQLEAKDASGDVKNASLGGGN